MIYIHVFKGLDPCAQSLATTRTLAVKTITTLRQDSKTRNTLFKLDPEETNTVVKILSPVLKTSGSLRWSEKKVY